ncbi:hypothetical protein H7849_23840 [Alloacidobacterium dinghuense]|uniref:Uncharacterized protein n=1 Tax=Alloacidobacterium dinghuense TaxID=2763107 RepID=A0A7G8BHI8_9BACT|nr:hypothetical protein H7849_23840 [Alloacidobacterium dinghuense]
MSKVGFSGDVCAAEPRIGRSTADFGEALVVVAEVECEAHYLAFDLPHSDDCFVVAFPAETTEAFSGRPQKFGNERV